MADETGQKVEGMQRKLREIEELINRSPDIMGRLDMQGRYTYANRAIEKQTGIPREKFIGQRIGELTADKEPGNLQLLRQTFAAAVAASAGRTVELNFRTKVFQLFFEPEADERGIVAAVMVFGRDITEVRRAEETLRPSQATLNAFFEASAGNLSIVDENLCIINADAITAGYFGLDHRTARGKCLKELSPQFEKEYGPMMREVLETGRPRINIEVRALAAGQTEIIWRASYFRVPLAGGKWGLGIIGTDITDMRKAEKSLQRFHQLIEHAPVAVAMARHGRTIYANNRYLKMFGFPNRDELYGHLLTEQLAPRCRNDVMEWLGSRGRDAHAPNEFETVGLRKDGSEFPFYVAIADVELDDGPAVLGSFIDITERKRTENAMKQAKEYADNLLKTANALIVELDTGAKVMAMNDTVESVTGYSRDDLEGRNWFKVLVPEDRFPGVEREFHRRAAEGEAWGQENAILARNGEERYIVWRNNVVRVHGRVTGTISFGIDITQMKRIEQELQASEERTRYILKHTPNAIAVFDNEMRYIMVSDRFLSDYKLGNRDIIGLSHYEVFPEVPKRWKEIHRRALAGAVEGCADDQFVRKDESIEYTRWEIRPWYDAMGRIGGIILFTEVTTERRRAEEALRQREEEFRILVENSPDIIARYDRRLRHVYINPKITQVTGIPKEKYIGKTNAELGMPANLVRLWSDYQNAVFETGKEQSVEYPFPGPKGTIYYHARVVPVRSSDGGVDSIISIMHDISEMKYAQQELARARELAERRADEAEEGRRTLDALMNNLPEGIMIVDADGKIRFMSKYMAQIAGTTPADARGGDSEKIESRLGREESPFGMREFPLKRAVRRGETTYSEERIVSTAGGDRMNVVITAVPIIGSGGQVLGAMTAWRDITDRKRMEDRLRRNEYELRTLVDNSPDLVVRFDKNMRYLYANPAYERITGMTRERLLGRTNEELGMPEEQVRYWHDAARKVFGSGREESVEFSFTSFFGKRYFWGRIIPEFAKDGTVEMVMTISRDITERKLADERIRYISFHDEVTGLYNRAYFEEELRRLDTERELPVSIIMGDINNLKFTNDTFGHEEGDRLLARIAAILRLSCRESDVIARWGGDEFTIILPKTGLPVAEGVAARITQECREVRDMFLQPSIALGVAAKEEKTANIYRVLREAEAIMYKNKAMNSRKNYETVFAALLKEVDRKEGRPPGHRRRLRELSLRVAGAVGLTKQQQEELELLAVLHDIGKIVVPQDILATSGSLMPSAWSHIAKYPETGYRIARTFSDYAYVADSILAGREQWNGGGYPKGLKEEEIPLIARIMAIIDAFDVMTHPRPYAPPFTRQEAVEEIRRGAGKQFDPRLVEKLVPVLSGE